MNGWSIIFAVTSMISGVWGTSVQSPGGLFSAVVFGLLFFMALATKVVRGIAC